MQKVLLHPQIQKMRVFGINTGDCRLDHDTQLLMDCALRFCVAHQPNFLPLQYLELNRRNFDFLITLYEYHSLDARHPIGQKYHPRRASRRKKEIRAPTRLAKRYSKHGPRLWEITSFRLPTHFSSKFSNIVLIDMIDFDSSYT